MCDFSRDWHGGAVGGVCVCVWEGGGGLTRGGAVLPALKKYIITFQMC